MIRTLSTTPPPAPGLILVATPIGNLGDVTHRAIEVLRSVDLVLCEDTRITRRLMSAHAIATPLATYHEHNAARVRPRILAQLRTGARMALVSDAGTPAISDPGYRLVRACRDAGIPVSTVPGPTALIAALAVSGLPTDSFYFGGFLPARSAARRARLARLADLGSTLVFYESPRRLEAMLSDADAALPGRRAVVARELTKLHEEFREGTIRELRDHYRETGPPRGEAVVLFGPPTGEPDRTGGLDALLHEALAEGTLRDSVRAVAEATGLPRAKVYQRALELRTSPGSSRDPALDRTEPDDPDPP